MDEDIIPVVRIRVSRCAKFEYAMKWLVCQRAFGVTAGGGGARGSSRVARGAFVVVRPGG